MRASAPAVAVLALWMQACGSGSGTAMKPEELYTIPVRLPDGRIIRAEQMIEPEQLQRGMQFRPELPENRGLLFYHGRAGFYPYWMYQVRVPLDIIWIDSRKRVVEVVHQAQPCPGPPEKCPAYGGGREAQYVLELRAGMARASGIEPGARIDF